MQQRQGLQATYRQGRIGLTTHAHGPQRRHCDCEPESLSTLWVRHLRLMPLPSSSFDIFKARFNPTAHAIPGGHRLLWCQIGHNQPDLLVALIPARKQGTAQSTLLFTKTIHLATPVAPLGGCNRSQGAKSLFLQWTNIALLIDAHEWVPSASHNVLEEPRGIQPAIREHQHGPTLWHAPLHRFLSVLASRAKTRRGSLAGHQLKIQPTKGAKQVLTSSSCRFVPRLSLAP